MSEPMMPIAHAPRLEVVLSPRTAPPPGDHPWAYPPVCPGKHAYLPQYFSLDAAHRARVCLNAARGWVISCGGGHACLERAGRDQPANR
jgi:hypothetical protein